MSHGLDTSKHKQACDCAVNLLFIYPTALHTTLACPVSRQAERFELHPWVPFPVASHEFIQDDELEGQPTETWKEVAEQGWSILPCVSMARCVLKWGT